MLQITPNGPFGKDTHPELPVSDEELLADLRTCFLAGADGVHLHVRDAAGAETLDPATVNRTCAAVRELAASVGVAVEIGLTTGAWIVPDLHDRIAMIREWEGVDCATVNLCEEGFEQVMAAMHETGTGVDVGLWAPQELPLLRDSGVLPLAARISIELAPTEPYFLSGDPRAVVAEIEAALQDMGATCPRLTHGMAEWTWPLVEEAFARGHSTRVGFEDSVLLPDGTVARDNAALVAAARGLAAARPGEPS